MATSIAEFEPVTRTFLYIQFLKLVNERKEQKKKNEETESLKDSVVTKREKTKNMGTSGVRDQRELSGVQEQNKWECLDLKTLKEKKRKEEVRRKK